MRIGHGYDVHRLAAGRRLVLGGIDIPYSEGLLGHSDADVLVHAVIDALLGAAGMGDIGDNFPDSSPEYAGISSLVLLERVGERVAEAGYELCNIDCTLVAERPKISEYKSQMKKNMAAALRCRESLINVKATTEEGLGFSGRGEAMSAHAVAALTKRK